MVFPTDERRTSILDLDARELHQLLDLAIRLKAERLLGPHAPTATARWPPGMALLFEPLAPDRIDL